MIQLNNREMTASAVDLRAQFLFSNTPIQAEAFASLISAMRSNKKSKDKSELLSLFWQGMVEFGPVVASWAADSVQELSKEEIVPKGEALHTELSSRLFPHTKTVLKAILRSSDNTLRSIRTVRRQHPSLLRELQEALQEDEYHEQFILPSLLFLEKEAESSSKCPVDGTVPHLFQSIRITKDNLSLFRELFHNEVVWNALRIQGQWEEFAAQFLIQIPRSHLNTCSLDSLCPSQLGTLLPLFPQLLHNPHFTPHPALIPGLLEICALEGTFKKGITPIASEFSLNSAKQLLTASQQNGQKSGGDVMEWLLKDEEKLKKWIEFVADPISGAIPSSLQSLCFFSGLLPSTIKLSVESSFKFLVRLAERRPQIANTAFILCLTLLSKPWLPTPRPLLLRTIAGLAVHRVTVAPVLRILVVVCQSLSDRNESIELVGDIVERWPTCIGGGMLDSLTTIKESDDVEWAKKKLQLIRRICVATDRSDDFLGSLSALLKKAGPLLPATIEVVAQLCKMEELELSAVAGQLREKVKGDNEALSAYASLLSIAAHLDDEEDLSSRFLDELWSLSTHSSSIVRTSVWKAMAEFKWTRLQEVIVPSSNQVSDEPQVNGGDRLLDRLQLGQASEEEKKAFCFLVHSMLKEDVESLPRPLYNRNAVRDDDPLLSLSGSLSSSLSPPSSSSSDCMSPIDALALFRTLVVSQPLHKRLSFATGRFRLLLTCIPLETFAERRKALAGWRDAVNCLVDILVTSRLSESAKGKGNEEEEDVEAWSRDRVCEDVKKSLLSSTQSLGNSLLVLTSLIGRKQEDASPSSLSTYRSWLASTVSFLHLASSSTTQSRVQPLFQISISSCRPCPDVAEASLALIQLTSPPSDLAFFDGDIGERSRLEEWLGGKESSNLIRSLLTSEEMKMDGNDVQVVDMRELAAGLGVDAVRLEIVEERMRKERGEDSKLNDDDVRKVIDTDGTGMKSLFSIFNSLPRSVQCELRTRMKKKVDKVASNGMSSSLLVSLLSSYALSSPPSLAATRLPSNYDYLPKQSLLRSVMERIPSSSHLVGCLSPIIRLDGRSLPPIDCASILQSYEKDHLPSVLRTAAQQWDVKLLCRLLASLDVAKVEVEVARTLSEGLERIVPRVGEKMARKATSIVFRAAEKDSSLLEGVRKAMQFQPVLDAFLEVVPSFKCAADLHRSPLKELLKDCGERIVGRKEWLLDVAVEACKGSDADVKVLLERIRGMGEGWRNGSCAVIGVCMAGLEEKERHTKLVEVLNAANQTKTEGREERRESLSRLWELFTVFLLTTTNENAERKRPNPSTIRYPPIGMPFIIMDQDSYLPRSFISGSLDFGLHTIPTNLLTQISVFVAECINIMCTVRIGETGLPSSLRIVSRLLLKKSPNERMLQIMDENGWREVCSEGEAEI